MPRILSAGSCAIAVAALGLTLSSAQASEKPSFVEAGALTVCIDPTFPPMEFIDNADDIDPSGFDVDLTKALASHWGVEAKFARMDFNGLLPSLEADRCGAVISGATLQAERQKKFHAVPYLDTRIVITAKAGGVPFADAGDLSGKTIAVQSGTTYVGRMEKINEQLEAKGLKPANVQLYPKQSDAIQQLLVGRADGVVTQDTEVAYRELQKPGQFTIVYTLPSDAFEPFAIYMKPNDADKAAVSTAIAALKADGTLGKIVDAWKLSQDQLNGIGE